MTQTLRVGAVVDGGTLPEPIRLVLVQEMGTHQKIAGQGQRSGKYIERVLSAEQISELKVSPLEESFDGEVQVITMNWHLKQIFAEHESYAFSLLTGI